MSLHKHSLTLGHIPYLNCTPFFAALEEQGFEGHLVAGVPSTLNRLLQQGQLHASPSSSYEYARNWRDYLLLPGHSISSTGKVTSVLLFSPVAPQELAGMPIAITGESATSINLLRVLLREFYQLDEIIDYVPEESVETLIGRKKPALLIGDRAMKAAHAAPEDMKLFDLGELWYQFTGLPFVFALWMVRRCALSDYREQLALLGGQLQASRDFVLKNSETYAQESAEKVGLPAAEIINYWKTIDFDLDEHHIKGLKLFFQLCFNHRLLTELPELVFLDESRN